MYRPKQCQGNSPIHQDLVDSSEALMQAERRAVVFALAGQRAL